MTNERKWHLYDLIAFFSEMERYPDPIMQERIKMAISALEALRAEKAALEKWHEVAVVELNDAHARIAELAAALVGAREALGECKDFLIGEVGFDDDDEPLASVLRALAEPRT
jgi:hypothetical protein